MEEADGRNPLLKKRKSQKHHIREHKGHDSNHHGVIYFHGLGLVNLSYKFMTSTCRAKSEWDLLAEGITYFRDHRMAACLLHITHV